MSFHDGIIEEAQCAGYVDCYWGFVPHHGQRHLQSTQSTMDKRLHDGGLFMQKLSELRMAKPEAAVKVSGGPCISIFGAFKVINLQLKVP